jgi:hypothetical protein
MKLSEAQPSVGRMKKPTSMSLKDKAHTPVCPASTKTSVRKGKKAKR